MSTIADIFDTMDYGCANDSPNLAEAWIKNKAFGPFINGKLSEPSVGSISAKISDPFTNKLLFNVHALSNADVDNAVASCKEINQEWNALSSERATHFLKIASLIEKHSSLLAQVESLTRNVQSKDAREFDIPALISWFKFYAGWIRLGSVELEEYEPYGVVAGVTGANTPLIALAWLVVPSLAAGNTVCLIVPPKDALPALLLAHICAEAGLPNGVLNVLPGRVVGVNHLISNQDVKKVVCYGPTEFVREIRRKLTDFPMKNQSMIMTGKTPMLVFETADLDSAVESAVKSAWYNQGAVPWSVKTVLVQESVYKSVVEKLKKRLSSLRVGAAFDKLADIGRPYDQQALKNLTDSVNEAARNGIEVFQVELSKNQASDEFITPTILIGGEGRSNLVIDDDVISPLISVVPFRTAKEAVVLANNSRYGFAASVWADNSTVSLEVADKLHMGTVWINTHGILDPAVPLEGWKASGAKSFGGIPGLLDNLNFEKCNETSSPKVRAKGSTVGADCISIDPKIIPAKAYKLYYGGAYKNADGNATQTILRDSKPFATIGDASRKDVRNAVEAAVQAVGGWSSASPVHRAQVMQNVVASVASNKQQLIGHLDLTKEQCAEDQFSSEEIVARTLKSLNFWAAACDKNSLSSAERSVMNMSVAITREALGVIGIGAYGAGNESDLFDDLLWPAICFGNCVILVVDSLKPTGCLELFKAIGNALPPGVVNILTGSGDILTLVAEHQNVSAVFHVNFPESLAKTVQEATCHSMKQIRGFNREALRSVQPRGWRNFYELALTRSKAIWISKGDIFAN